MDQPLTVSDGFRAEILRRGAVGAAAWLDQLPQLWEDLRQRWGLTMDGVPISGSTSLVVPVLASTSRAALKLMSPVTSAEAEATALEAFDAHWAVRLLDADLASSALLLEWLDGPSLVAHPDRSTAMRIAGDIAGHLSQTPAPQGVPSLASGASGWRRRLHQQHEIAERAGAAIPDALFALAVQIIDNLDADPTTTLTHGDLSLFNIIRAGSDRWVAIDPHLVVGTAAHEAHTVVRSHLEEVATSPHPPELVAAWTREFTRAAGLNYLGAQRLSFARYVASYYWESQNGGSRLNVRHLHAAIAITAGLC